MACLVECFHFYKGRAGRPRTGGRWPGRLREDLAPDVWFTVIAEMKTFTLTGSIWAIFPGVPPTHLGSRGEWVVPRGGLQPRLQDAFYFASISITVSILRGTQNANIAYGSILENVAVSPGVPPTRRGSQGWVGGHQGWPGAQASRCILFGIDIYNGIDLTTD